MKPHWNFKRVLTREDWTRWGLDGEAVEDYPFTVVSYGRSATRHSPTNTRCARLAVNRGKEAREHQVTLLGERLCPTCKPPLPDTVRALLVVAQAMNALDEVRRHAAPEWVTLMRADAVMRERVPTVQAVQEAAAAASADPAEPADAHVAAAVEAYRVAVEALRANLDRLRTEAPEPEGGARVGRLARRFIDQPEARAAAAAIEETFNVGYHTGSELMGLVAREWYIERDLDIVDRVVYGYAEHDVVSLHHLPQDPVTSPTEGMTLKQWAHAEFNALVPQMVGDWPQLLADLLSDVERTTETVALFVRDWPLGEHSPHEHAPLLAYPVLTEATWAQSQSSPPQRCAVLAVPRIVAEDVVAQSRHGEVYIVTQADPQGLGFDDLGETGDDPDEVVDPVDLVEVAEQAVRRRTVVPAQRYEKPTARVQELRTRWRNQYGPRYWPLRPGDGPTLTTASQHDLPHLLERCRLIAVLVDGSALELQIPGAGTTIADDARALVTQDGIELPVSTIVGLEVYRD